MKKISILVALTVLVLILSIFWISSKSELVGLSELPEPSILTHNDNVTPFKVLEKTVLIHNDNVTPFKVIEKTVWPPIITYSEIDNSCEGINWVAGPPLKLGISYADYVVSYPYTLEKMEQGYCELIIEEGIQDGLYMTYNYSFPGDGQALNVGFTLKVQTCGGLSGDVALECEKESDNFDPLSLIMEYVPRTYR